MAPGINLPRGIERQKKIVSAASYRQQRLKNVTCEDNKAKVGEHVRMDLTMTLSLVQSGSLRRDSGMKMSERGNVE
jgi:hypothetical protein